MAVKKNILTIAADNGGTSSGSGAGGAYGTLQYGSSGAGVKDLQQTLNRLGYNVGAADGIFGNNTKNAVLQYQKDKGLTADGIVGANTWNALRTPVTPTNTPPVDYAGIISGMDKQQAGFQNTTAPKTAAQQVKPPEKPDTGSPVDGGNAPETGGNLPTTGGNIPTTKYPSSGNSAAPTSLPSPDAVDIPQATVTNPVSNPVTPEPTLEQQYLAEYTTSTPSSDEPAASGYTSPERDPYYEPNYRRLLNELEAYPEFKFDKNSNPLWGSLAKQYRREGQRATQDALGQAASLTGGIPSTAAVTAASQQGDYYAAQLSDRLQDVYNTAYQQYLDQYSRMLGLAQEYGGKMPFEEGQFIDDRNFGYGQYLDDRNFQYQHETDAYNRSQTAMGNAQDRIGSFLAMGGDPSQIDPELLAQSGYSANEIQQMQNYYAQQAALQAAGGSSGGSRNSGGSSGGSTGSNAPDDSGVYSQLMSAGVTDYGTAYEYLRNAGMNTTDANRYAKYFAETYYPQANQDMVDSLMAMFPGGVIGSDDWRVVSEEFDPKWLADNGFTQRGMTGEYRAEAEQPAAKYNIGTAIEKAVSNFGAAKNFLTQNGAPKDVINGLKKQSTLGLDNDAYKEYLRGYISDFLNGMATPSYNQTVNDLAERFPQVDGDVLSLLHVPVR